MKRIYVNEKWCLGCHLCEYYCAFANSGKTDMAKALRDVRINPRIQVEEGGSVSFAGSCRHCEEPLCVKSCISGSLSVKDGVITVNRDKCVGCY
ncbi:MAG: 4Fe-4S ferredoxin, partial [Bacillota bacterium]|nr:4Fe-4S ferredoxin [Bacillota bacterium]